MGCSNPHPHGQAWSLSEIPTEPAKEIESQRRYALRADLPKSDAPRGPAGRPNLILEYTHFEVGVPREEGRIVLKNEHWVALVPWWAIWPYEILRKCLLSQNLLTPNPGSSDSVSQAHSLHSASDSRREGDFRNNSLSVGKAIRQPLLLFFRLLDGHSSTPHIRGAH